MPETPKVEKSTPEPSAAAGLWRRFQRARFLPDVMQRRNLLCPTSYVSSSDLGREWTLASSSAAVSREVVAWMREHATREMPTQHGSAIMSSELIVGDARSGPVEANTCGVCQTGPNRAPFPALEASVRLRRGGKTLQASVPHVR
jgi:hypothetical protein